MWIIITLKPPQVMAGPAYLQIAGAVYLYEQQINEWINKQI